MRPNRPVPLSILFLALVLPLAACQEDRTDSPVSLEVREAKGGVKGKPSGDEVSVESTDPDSALQGEMLEVRVLGDGFDDGSTVSFEIDGVTVDDITVQETRFVSEQELAADIAVREDATVTTYDVAVQAARGKKGIGLELFDVKPGFGPFPEDDPSDDSAAIVKFRDDPDDHIRSDAEVRTDSKYTGPEYANGVCGVFADLGAFGDARLDADDGYKGNMRRSCGEERVFVFDFSAPLTGDPGPVGPDPNSNDFVNVHDVTSVTGSGALRRGLFVNARCGRLVFNPDDTEVPNNGSDLLSVSFDDQGDGDPLNDTWTIRTVDTDGDGLVGEAYCQGEGRLFLMPFEATFQRTE